MSLISAGSISLDSTFKAFFSNFSTFWPVNLCWRASYFQLWASGAYQVRIFRDTIVTSLLLFDMQIRDGIYRWTLSFIVIDRKVKANVSAFRRIQFCNRISCGILKKCSFFVGLLSSALSLWMVRNVLFYHSPIEDYGAGVRGEEAFSSKPGLIVLQYLRI